MLFQTKNTWLILLWSVILVIMSSMDSLNLSEGARVKEQGERITKLQNSIKWRKILLTGFVGTDDKV